MSIPAACIALVKEFEGLRLKPYRDLTGTWTIGWGHCGGVNEHTAPITRAEAEELLARDLGVAAGIVDSHVRVPLNENQRGALISFCFNVGPGRAGYKDGLVWLKSGRNSTMLSLLNQGQYQRAAQEFAKWANAFNLKTGRKEPVAGLLRRRIAERDLFLKPVEA